MHRNACCLHVPTKVSICDVLSTFTVDSVDHLRIVEADYCALPDVASPVIINWSQYGKINVNLKSK
jgi:hypothetical protein